MKRNSEKVCRLLSVGFDLEKFGVELSNFGFSFEQIAEIGRAMENSFTKIKTTPTINPVKDENSNVDYSIKADKGKYRPTLCHQITIKAVSKVREHGANRYGGTETWKRVEEQRYKDALYRHWLAYLENPDGLDAESGLPILWHVACNLDFLLEMQRERMEKKED